MALVVSSQEVKKIFDTLRDGDAFEAEFAACCHPAAASCSLVTGLASSKAHLCLYVPVESSSAAASVVNPQHRDILPCLASRKKKKAKESNSSQMEPTHLE